MVYGKKLRQYQQVSVATAGKVNLVIMCYEKAIQSLHHAKSFYVAGDYESKYKALQKAVDIINELQGNLDFQKGGSIAKNLDSIYTYLKQRLIDGDLKRDLSTLDEAITIMGELKSAWEGISEGAKAGDGPVDEPVAKGIKSESIAA